MGNGLLPSSLTCWLAGLRRSASKLIDVVAGCLSSSLCGPLPSAASQYGSCLSLEKASKREREPEMEATVFL